MEEKPFWESGWSLLDQGGLSYFLLMLWLPGDNSLNIKCEKLTPCYFTSARHKKISLYPRSSKHCYSIKLMRKTCHERRSSVSAIYWNFQRTFFIRFAEFEAFCGNLWAFNWNLILYWHVYSLNMAIQLDHLWKLWKKVKVFILYQIWGEVAKFGATGLFLRDQ